MHLLGENLTADARIDVGGVKAANVKELPGKNGLSFDLNVADIDGSGDHETVTVWTRGGEASVPLDVSDFSQCAPVIEDVRPKRVSACDKDASLHLLGENLTADARIDVGGVEAANVKELPGKNGLSFELNVADVPVSKDAMVNVWTEGGYSSASLDVSDFSQCAPVIQDVQRERVSACARDMTVRLLGENLTAGPLIYVGGVQAKDVTELPSGRGLLFNLNVTDIDVSEGDAIVNVSTEGGDTSVSLDVSDFGRCAPVIEEVRPKRVSACAEDVSLRLLGENLTADARIDVGGVMAANVKELPSKNGLSFELNVGDITVSKGQVMVDVSTEGGDVSVSLELSDFGRCEQ